jgi:hypothetical protein
MKFINANKPHRNPGCGAPGKLAKKSRLLLSFGFVSGHDFSRGRNRRKENWALHAAERLAAVPAPDFSPGERVSNPRERFGMSIEGFSPGGGVPRLYSGDLLLNGSGLCKLRKNSCFVSGHDFKSGR